jgi:hypothetical protein
VHRFPGEKGLHHKINAERTDRLALETGEAHGGETIRVVDRGRDKLLVEVMLLSAKHPGAEFEAPDKVSARPSLLDLPGLGFLCGAAPGTILPDDVDLGTLGAMSIIPDALPEPLHTLSERAFLLQRVHFRKVMSGYRMEVERSGRIVPRGIDSVAALEVVDDRVSLLARARDIALDGRPLRSGERVELLQKEHEITWRGGSLSYRAVRRPDDVRWPYLARLESPRRSVPLFAGGTYLMGRDREACDIALPDRPTAENIIWRDGKDAGPIQIRGGSAERTTFRTDAIFVATRAASLDLTGDCPRISNLSGSCPIHILRDDDSLVRLKKDAAIDLRPGDELLVGNQVFALLPPAGATAASTGVAGLTQRTQIGPVASQRHEKGPGSKGRRPLVGGARGRLVVPDNTYAALLGISPATERTVSPFDPDPMSLSLDETSVELDGYEPFKAGEVAAPGPTRADDWTPSFADVDLVDPFEELPTIQGESEVLARLVPLPPPRTPADLPRVRRTLKPRGLQIGAVEPVGGFGTLRRRSGALPGLSLLLPGRPSPPPISLQGD